MPSPKIDAHGHFLPFPGYSVISKVNLETSEVWHTLLAALESQPLLRSAYAFLPIESWHMTPMRLFTKDFIESKQKDWRNVEKEYGAFFKSLSSVFEKASITPSIDYQSLNVKGVIQLVFSMDDASMQHIQSIAKQFKCEHLISTTPHITLAYQYTALSEAQFQWVTHILSAPIDAIFKEKQLTLKAPEVCYFHDMTAFKPWHQTTAPVTQLSLFNQNKAADTPPLTAAQTSKAAASI